MSLPAESSAPIARETQPRIVVNFLVRADLLSTRACRAKAYVRDTDGALRRNHKGVIKKRHQLKGDSIHRGFRLHRVFVSRRSVKRRNRHVVHPQVNAELRAMVDEMA